MPIDVHVDHVRHLVVARASGVLQDHEVFGYQLSTWSRSDVAGYDELVDMTNVTEIAVPSASRVRELAALSASMDQRGGTVGAVGAETQPGRFAIVAPQEIAHALGKMYAVFREMEPGTTKEVSVFRTMDSALIFLGISGPLEG